MQRFYVDVDDDDDDDDKLMLVKKIMPQCVDYAGWEDERPSAQRASVAVCRLVHWLLCL